MTTFAERLRELRVRAGLTQTQLAEASGLPLGSIRNYEQGQREPYWQVVFVLAEALGADCRAFADCVSSEEEPSPPKARPAPATPAPPPADELQATAKRKRGRKGK